MTSYTYPYSRIKKLTFKHNVLFVRYIGFNLKIFFSLLASKIKPDIKWDLSGLHFVGSLWERLRYCPVVQKTQFHPSEFMHSRMGGCTWTTHFKEQLFSLMLGFCISQVYATRKLCSLQEGQRVLKILSAKKYIQCLSPCLDNKKTYIFFLFFLCSKDSLLISWS